jgi:hypothetical protein
MIASLIRKIFAPRLTRVFVTRALHARHLALLCGGRYVCRDEGPEVRIGERTARWSPIRGAWILRRWRDPARIERSAVRAALWLLGTLDRRGRGY